MAVNWTKEIEVTRSNAYLIYPEDIKIHADMNGRHDLPDVEWLIADILKQGQIQPVVIRNDGGIPVLVSGFSRWRAISEINKRKLAPVKIQVRCTYLQCSEQEGFLANIAENRFRNTTSDIDDAHNIKKLMNRYAMTEEQVAGVYFPTAKTEEEKKTAMRWVKKRSALIGLTDDSAKAIKEGRIKGTAAAEIAKLSAEQQKQVISKPGKIKSSDVRKVSGKTAPVDIKSRLQAVIDSGKFEVNGKKFSASDELVEFLAGLLAGKKSKAAKA